MYKVRDAASAILLLPNLYGAVLLDDGFNANHNVNR